MKYAQQQQKNNNMKINMRREKKKNLIPVFNPGFPQS